MKLPEFLEVLVSDEFVNSIMRLGAEERWGSVEHDEDNNTSCEDVSLNTGVVSLLHFRRFVSFGSDSRFELIVTLVSFGISRQSKVRYFESKLTIKEDVFWFQIPMRYTNFRQILNGSNELFGICTGDFFFEASLLGKEIKELTTFCEFQNNKWSLLFRAVSDLDGGLRSRVDDVDEVGEV